MQNCEVFRKSFFLSENTDECLIFLRKVSATEINIRQLRFHKKLLKKQNKTKGNVRKQESCIRWQQGTANPSAFQVPFSQAVFIKMSTSIFFIRNLWIFEWDHLLTLHFRPFSKFDKSPKLFMNFHTTFFQYLLFFYRSQTIDKLIFEIKKYLSNQSPIY